MKSLNLKDYFKTSSINKSIDELVKSPVSDLIGVSDDAAQALLMVNIHSVFDLAFSEIFKSAVYITDIDNPLSEIHKTHTIPRELLDRSVDTTHIESIKNLGIKAIRGIGEHSAQAIADSLAVISIRDLALWPPYLASKEIINHHFELGSDGFSDPESPQDLVPKTGEYPVEIVNYNSVVLIKAPRIENKKYRPLESSGKIKFNFEDQTTGFTEPGFGALLSFSQCWYVQGITNGSLLRSVPLAPGESTKIAVIDWRRSTAGNTTENIAQTESLSNTLNQKRAMEEIASATAKEMQSGSSELDTSSDTDSTSEGGWQFALFSGAGGQRSESDVDTKTTAFTSSQGEKDLSSKMQQKIDSSTQQKSFSSRNRRASVVTELLETESETITTRTVTNYNHMHALTMQYWQVIQIYKTEVKLENYRRCLFIPMEIFDFKDERIVARFRSVLVRAALNSFTRELLLATSNKVDVRFTAIPTYESIVIPDDTDQDARHRALKEKAKAKARLHINFMALNKYGLIENFDINRLSWTMNADFILYNVKWETNESNALKTIRITAENGQITEISNNGGGFSNDTINPDMGSPIPLSSIDNIVADFGAIAADYDQSLTFRFKMFGNRFQNIKLYFTAKKDKTSIKILEMDQPIASNELSDLLNQHSLYYSQQIWLNSDVHFLTLQLSQYSFDGRPVVESIDPKPVAVAGNCLGFIWHQTEDKEWKEWVKNNISLEKITTQKIALPTDGVFGEAVLGRSNSAEKLDLTRFWNWQDSPIPINAPDIAAIQAGQHQISQPLQPGNLDAPVVNIMNPPALPDPTGMQGILQALVASTLFRDMSGIIQAGALAGTATTTSGQGAIAAGQQLSSNLNAQVDLTKTLAALVPMLFGLPPLNVPGTQNISNSGAAVNHGAKMDEQNKQKELGNSNNSNGQTGGPGNGGNNGNNQSGGGNNGTIFASTSPQKNNESAAFNTAIGNRNLPGSIILAENTVNPSGPGLIDFAESMLGIGNDDIKDLSATEKRDFYRRLANYTLARDPESLSAVLLLHWLDGRGATKIIKPDRIKGLDTVRNYLIEEDKKVFLSEKKAFIGKTRDSIKGIKPRIKHEPNFPAWDGRSDMAMDYTGVAFDIVTLTDFVFLQKKVGENKTLTVAEMQRLDVFTSTHSGGLRCDVVAHIVKVDNSHHKINFVQWKSKIMDNYNWNNEANPTAPKKLTLPNPDFGNPFSLANPVAPEKPLVTFFHKNALDVEAAGFAQTFDFETEQWDVTDPDIVGPFDIFI